MSFFKDESLLNRNFDRCVVDYFIFLLFEFIHKEIGTEVYREFKPVKLGRCCVDFL